MHFFYLIVNRDQNAPTVLLQLHLKQSSQTLQTHSQTEILTHSDPSNGPNSTESFPHYLGILNPKEEVEGAGRNKYGVGEQERGTETKEMMHRERM